MSYRSISDEHPTRSGSSSRRIPTSDKNISATSQKPDEISPVRAHPPTHLPTPPLPSLPTISVRYRPSPVLRISTSSSSSSGSEFAFLFAKIRDENLPAKQGSFSMQWFSKCHPPPSAPVPCPLLFARSTPIDIAHTRDSRMPCAASGRKVPASRASRRAPVATTRRCSTEHARIIRHNGDALPLDLPPCFSSSPSSNPRGSSCS